MGHYRFSAVAKAPREQVFDLWTNLDRAGEWIEGLTRVTDVTGPTDKAGTRYTTWFGRLRGGNEILEAERPRLLKTRLVSGVLRGTTQVTFDEEGDGTRVNLEFWTDGIVPAIAARIFATGSYKGSFRGELEHFVRIADREASRDH